MCVILAIVIFNQGIVIQAFITFKDVKISFKFLVLLKGYLTFTTFRFLDLWLYHCY